MRFAYRVLVCFCFVLLAGNARASRITIQEPPVPITAVTVTPFPVTFSDSCSVVLLPTNANYGNRGCFGFLNRTAGDWTGLTLVLETGSPTNGGFVCDAPAQGVQLAFQSSSCGFDSTLGTYVLSFTDGVIPNDTQQYFVISEDDLDPASITFEAYPTFASTPEPPAFLLLGTGLVCATGLMWSRRRTQEL
jgi:hypothetical protein